MTTQIQEYNATEVALEKLRVELKSPAPDADFVPTSQQIIEVVANSFSVDDAKALEWLTVLFGHAK